MSASPGAPEAPGAPGTPPAAPAPPGPTGGPAPRHLLSRDEILSAKDARTVEVEVPEWGGSVLVKAMTGTERDAFEDSMIIGKGAKRDLDLVNVRAKLVAASVVDEQGALVFSSSDVALLGQRNAGALTRVFEMASSLSGFDVDALAADLGKGQSGGSGTA